MFLLFSSLRFLVEDLPCKQNVAMTSELGFRFDNFDNFILNEQRNMPKILSIRSIFQHLQTPYLVAATFQSSADDSSAHHFQY